MSSHPALHPAYYPKGWRQIIWGWCQYIIFLSCTVNFLNEIKKESTNEPWLQPPDSRRVVHLSPLFSKSFSQLASFKIRSRLGDCLIKRVKLLFQYRDFEIFDFLTRFGMHFNACQNPVPFSRLRPWHPARWRGGDLAMTAPSFYQVPPPSLALADIRGMIQPVQSSIYGVCICLVLVYGWFGYALTFSLPESGIASSSCKAFFLGTRYRVNWGGGIDGPSHRPNSGESGYI